MENYEDYLKKVADLGRVDQNSTNNFLETFLRIEYGEGYTYEGDLQNNLPHGQGVLYYPNRQVLAIGNWKEGLLNCNTNRYHENGKICQSGNFVKGMLEGRGCQYFDNGNIGVDGSFKNGEKDGFCTVYSMISDGNGQDFHRLSEVGVFKNDMLNGEGTIYQNYYRERNWDVIEEQGIFLHGKLNGNGIRNFRSEHNPKLHEVGEFKMGRLNGFGKRYHKFDKSFIEGYFIMGEFINKI